MAPRPNQGLTRLSGAGLMAVGLALGGYNVYTLEHSHRYSPKGMLFAPVFVLFGLFTLVVGAQPVNPRTGKAPLWIRIGYGATMAIGLGLGIALVSFVGC